MLQNDGNITFRLPFYQLNPKEQFIQNRLIFYVIKFCLLVLDGYLTIGYFLAR
jgi:hypothetical protein